MAWRIQPFALQMGIGASQILNGFSRKGINRNNFRIAPVQFGEP
jgi:hypothetical protein